MCTAIFGSETWIWLAKIISLGSHIRIIWAINCVCTCQACFRHKIEHEVKYSSDALSFFIPLIPVWRRLKGHHAVVIIHHYQRRTPCRKTERAGHGSRQQTAGKLPACHKHVPPAVRSNNQTAQPRPPRCGPRGDHVRQCHYLLYGCCSTQTVVPGLPDCTDLLRPSIYK